MQNVSLSNMVTKQTEDGISYAAKESHVSSYAPLILYTICIEIECCYLLAIYLYCTTQSDKACTTN